MTIHPIYEDKHHRTGSFTSESFRGQIRKALPMNISAEEVSDQGNFWTSLLTSSEFWAALIGAVVGGFFTLIATWFANKGQLLRLNRQRLGEKCIELAKSVDETYAPERQFKAWLNNPVRRVPSPVAREFSEGARGMQFWVKNEHKLSKHITTATKNFKTNACFCPEVDINQRWHSHEEKRIHIQEDYRDAVIDALVALPKHGEATFARRMRVAARQRNKSLHNILSGKPCQQSNAPYWWNEEQEKKRVERLVDADLAAGFKYRIKTDTLHITSQHKPKLQLRNASQRSFLDGQSPSGSPNLIIGVCTHG